MKKKSCECKICLRYKEFKKHMDTIDNEDAKKFFENLFGYLYELEDELEICNIYQRNLRQTYPKIYREMLTIEKIKPGMELFPQINI